MWKLRLINGPQAGTNYPLKQGENFIGRADNLDISLNSKGISKRHCKIILNGNDLELVDLGSSNGTFINGRLIQTGKLQLGDRLSFHQIIAELIYDEANLNPNHEDNLQADAYKPNDKGNYTNGNQTKKPKDLKESINLYIESVVMPALYKLIQQFELKWVLGCFILAFILLVSLLSTIPMLQISKASIEKESQRRALSIARHIVDKNKALIERGLSSSLSVRSANREEGVKAALIIDAESGRVIAPASKAGAYESIPFVNLARDISRYKNNDYVETMLDDTIGASVPIRVYDPSKQTTTVFAYAVVIYDISTHAFDDGKALSLFVQTFAIAVIIGFVLFYLMNKLIEKPILALNNEIDKSLKDGSNIESKYKFPALNSLLTNINSLAARASGSETNNVSLGDNFESESNHIFEAQNLVRLFHSPAIAVDKDLNIIDCNPEFENLTGLISGNLQNQSIEEINDQAFILSIRDLAQRSSEQPNLIATNVLDFNGTSMEIDSQAMNASTGVEYFIFTIKEQEGGDFV